MEVFWNNCTELSCFAPFTAHIMHPQAHDKNKEPKGAVDVKKAVKSFLLFCFALIIMSACSNTNTSAQPSERIVTRVDVLCRQDQTEISRQYTHDEKIESVLLYLRLLHPQKPADTLPELSNYDIYEITVYLSGGKKRVYRQTGHRYFSTDYKPWQTIDPEDAHKLYTLLRQLPGDVPVYAIFQEI